MSFAGGARLGACLLSDPTFLLPKLSNKASIAASSTRLEDLSSFPGSNKRGKILGRRSGLSSIKTPSDSIGSALRTLESRSDSSSGYAMIDMVIQYAKPTAVNAGIVGALVAFTWCR